MRLHWCCSVLRCVWLFVTPWTAACQVSLSFTIPGVCSDLCSLSWWCRSTISPSIAPFSSRLQSFLASESFPMLWLFASGGQSIGASVLASVFPVNIHGWFLLGLLVWYPCCPGDSLESYPTRQFERISSLMLSLVYGPTFTSVHGYWKNHIFGYIYFCWQSDISAF